MHNCICKPLSSSYVTAMQRILEDLKQEFSIKDLESLHYFLDIEASFTPYGLHLSQAKYICNLLRQANMIDANAVRTPMATKPTPQLFGQSLSDATPNRKLVGSLQ